MQHYHTHDIQLAAVLLHKQCRLVELDRLDPKRSVFVFEDSPDLQEIVVSYWRDDLLCPAQSLLAAYKRAKHILYDYKT